jgi:hypothetical protein
MGSGEVQQRAVGQGRELGATLRKPFRNMTLFPLVAPEFSALLNTRAAYPSSSCQKDVRSAAWYRWASV